MKRHWPGDDSARMRTRAGVAPTDTSSGEVLVHHLQIETLLRQLSTAFAMVLNRSHRFRLAGHNAVVVPQVESSTAPPFVAEGGPAPVLQNVFGGTMVGPPSKMLAIAAITGEIADYGIETAVTLVQRSVTEAISDRLDNVGFDSAAATAIRPAGLLHGVADLGATAGGGITAMVDDISKIAGAMGAAGLRSDSAIFVGSPEVAMRLRLLSGPKFNNAVIGVPSLPADTLVGVVPEAIGSVFTGGPEIEIGRDGAVHLEDVSPLPLGTAGSPPTVAAPAISAWQHNVLLIRIRQRVAWSTLAAGAVQRVSDVSW